MRRVLVAASIFVFAAVAAVGITTSRVQAGAQTCADKHCPPGARCCYSCSGNPVCIKGGFPCPECAPQ